MMPKEPVMLLSFVNMKLRDFYDSLDKMCNALDVDRTEVEAKLSGIGYHYDADRNQFI